MPLVEEPSPSKISARDPTDRTPDGDATARNDMAARLEDSRNQNKSFLEKSSEWSPRIRHSGHIPNIGIQLDQSQSRVEVIDEDKLRITEIDESNVVKSTVLKKTIANNDPLAASHFSQIEMTHSMMNMEEVNQVR